VFDESCNNVGVYDWRKRQKEAEDKDTYYIPRRPCKKM